MEIQLSVTASMENSLPMEGRAMLMDVAMKGVRKAAVAATRRTTLLSTPLPAR
jgi:hypothetical protein